MCRSHWTPTMTTLPRNRVQRDTKVGFGQEHLATSGVLEHDHGAVGNDFNHLATDLGGCGQHRTSMRGLSDVEQRAKHEAESTAPEACTPGGPSREEKRPVSVPELVQVAVVTGRVKERDRIRRSFQVATRQPSSPALAPPQAPPRVEGELGGAGRAPE